MMNANVATAVTPDAQPKKLFYRINEVAKMTGLKPYVLRYWETEFTDLSPKKDSSDQRRYRDKDIQTVRAIRKLLYEDRFTIKGARKRLKEEMKTMTADHKGSSTTRSKKSKPRKTETKTTRAQGKHLSDSLYHLRSEVNDLIKILGA